MSDTLFYYVRDTGSRVAHHWDYTRNRTDHALCGHPYSGTNPWESTERPRALCLACQALTGPRELSWLKSAVERMKDEHRQLTERCQAQELELRNLRRKTENQRVRLIAQDAALATARRLASATAPKVPKSSTTVTNRQPPRIRVVSGGLPGLGKRR